MTLVILAGVFTACNQTQIDLVYKFDKAIISITDEKTIEVEIKSWLDFENSDVVQITDKEGNTYLTHYSKCILIKTK